jgi:hypothetical protein
MPRSIPSPSSLRLLALAAIAAPLPLVAQTTVTVPCAADNTLYESIFGDASNGAGPGLFVGLNAFGSIRRAVLRFDVAAALPAGAEVLAAQLDLNVTRSHSSSPPSLAITGHRLVQPFGEGTSIASGGSSGGGGGALATTGDSTWLHRTWPAPLWTTPGGDFATTPSLQAAMPPIGSFSSQLSRQTAADVQAWLDAPAGNHGWLLRTTETQSYTAHRLASRESPTNPPALHVTYLLPGQNGAWGTGCPVGAGNFTAAFSGAPIGGTTVQIPKTNAPVTSIGADFFALALDPLGTPLIPGCTVYLPLAEVLLGGVFVTDGAGSGSSSLALPVGFTGQLIACQAVVLTNTPLGYVVSNTALTVLQ